MRIGVDAMGGDLAPAEQVAGALAARELLTEDDRIVLYGRQGEIVEHLKVAGDWSERIAVVDCPEMIGMSEPPVEALRAKQNSSLVRLAQAHRSGEVDAMISAGNTGACVAAAQMHLRRLAGVHRPGIAIIVPTFHGPVVLCDVGANVNCRPLHLLQYGVMAGIYLNRVAGVEAPRVGLMSIGEEDTKGNALVRRTHELFRRRPEIRFVGNVEGRDLFRNSCEVVVCEGFVGNVCLKLMEGLAEGLFKALARELAQQTEGAFAMKARLALGALAARYDYSEYGGAPLLGVNGICIICHGSSNARAIYNAIRVSREFATQGVNERITTELTQNAGMGE
ncbi:MAG: phosphate acyltransferase PlsX [Planctomycetes bacterium]|nr:phosphate acyltransferase PlsX [Planctomycetota bacterium]